MTRKNLNQISVYCSVSLRSFDVSLKCENKRTYTNITHTASMIFTQYLNIYGIDQTAIPKSTNHEIMRVT